MNQTDNHQPSWSDSTAEQRDQRRQDYVSGVLSQYCRLSSTSGMVCRRDRRTAVGLFEAGVPVAAVEAAFTVETVRRSLRSPYAPPLGLIQSFRYFVPIVNQVLTNPPDQAPIHYLAFKINSLADHRLGFPLQDSAL